jgi:hypothetical protein
MVFDPFFSYQRLVTTLTTKPIQNISDFTNVGTLGGVYLSHKEQWHVVMDVKPELDGIDTSYSHCDIINAVLDAARPSAHFSCEVIGSNLAKGDFTVLDGFLFSRFHSTTKKTFRLHCGL